MNPRCLATAKGGADGLIEWLAEVTYWSYEDVLPQVVVGEVK